MCLTGTATRGTDYTLDSSFNFDNNGCFTVNYPANLLAPASVTIAVTGDTAMEPDETVIATLKRKSNTPANVVISSSEGSATYTILNDDNNPPTGSLTITGTATQGQTLTTNTSGIADADGLGTFNYQWKRGGTSISGATPSTYMLVQADVGQTITVTVSWTDGIGTAESLTSTATGAVQVPAPAKPTGFTATAGSAQVTLAWTNPRQH
ncbi:MAG: hypothetical protein F4162_00200 [Synechococcus sp. SB0676_bin_10]|uniref:Uncharacterized protein n=1 Tax=Synechococcus sp. SB0676_bin_10 TaxID=2604869 RepID=A0A6B1F5M5_9SYNE|nr:hypothetical protein [Synechococcus sp. SB0676_bin_10]